MTSPAFLCSMKRHRSAVPAIEHADPNNGPHRIGHGPFDLCRECLQNHLEYWPQFISVDPLAGCEREVEETIMAAAASNKAATQVARGRTGERGNLKVNALIESGEAQPDPRAVVEAAVETHRARRDDEPSAPSAPEGGIISEPQPPSDNQEGSSSMAAETTKAPRAARAPRATTARAPRAPKAQAPVDEGAKAKGVKVNKSEKWPAGVSLEATYKGTRYTAETFTDEGVVKVEITNAPGRADIKGVYATPSTAGVAVTGGIRVNGYRFWKVVGAEKPARAPRAAAAPKAEAKPRAARARRKISTAPSRAKAASARGPL